MGRARQMRAAAGIAPGGSTAAALEEPLGKGPVSDCGITHHRARRWSSPRTASRDRVAMRHRDFVHVVWATRNRAPLLTLAAVEFLAGFFARICREEDSALVQFGAVRTHVHLLIRSHPSRAMSRTIQRMKGGSSYYGSREHGLTIRWHPGYSLDSVSMRAIPRVAEYIANQHLRHPREAIAGWRPTSDHIPAFLESLDRERIAGPNRRPHGGS